MRTVIEFYEANTPQMIAIVESAMVPTVGSMISIRGVTWKVASVSYAVDNASSYNDKVMRANIDLVEP